MGLKWTEPQRAIYDLICEGLPPREIKAKGFKGDLIDKVKKSINKGDIPGGIVEIKTPAGSPKPLKPGESIFEASTKGERVALEPIILMRYDSVRHALGWGKKEYPLDQFIDEATDIATELVGAIPPGFIKEEEPKEPVAVAVKEEEHG